MLNLLVDQTRKDGLCAGNLICANTNMHILKVTWHVPHLVTWHSWARGEKAVFSLTGPRVRLGQWISDISLNLDTRHLQATGTVSNLYFPTTSVCVYLCVLARQPQTTCEISPQWHWVAPLLTFKCYSGTCWFMACSDVHNILT